MESLKASWVVTHDKDPLLSAKDSGFILQQDHFSLLYIWPRNASMFNPI